MLLLHSAGRARARGVPFPGSHTGRRRRQAEGRRERNSAAGPDGEFLAAGGNHVLRTSKGSPGPAGARAPALHEPAPALFRLRFYDLAGAGKKLARLYAPADPVRFGPDSEAYAPRLYPRAIPGPPGAPARGRPGPGRL